MISEIEKLLLASANDAAGSFDFSSECWIRLKELVSRGAERMEMEEISLDDDKVDVARTNLSDFVDEMTKVARRMRLTEVSENVFAQTLGNLYPLWPFY